MFLSLFFAKKAKILLFSCFAAVCAAALCGCEKPQPTAKHIFLFVADGASYAQRRLTAMARESGLFVDTLPVQGTAVPAVADAAAAGALATGKATGAGMISMISAEEPALPLITSIMARNGYAVGLVTDAGLDGAAAASFYAHSEKRQNYYDIAVQLKDSPLSLLIGQDFKRRKAFQKEDLDVVLKKSGHRMVSRISAGEKMPSGKVVAALKNVPFALDAKAESPNLALFVEKAVEKLQGGDFLIVAVGEKIGLAAESRDTAALIAETAAFDLAVKKAFDFYAAHPQDTLIVVASTAEAGGLVLGTDGAVSPDVFKTQKVSIDTFKSAINRFRRRRPEGATLENFMPKITENFGLRLLTREQKKELAEAVKNGDETAAKTLETDLTGAETALLREAFRHSMADKPKTDALLRKYGKLDPLQATVLRILDDRAHTGYAAHGRTAVPTPVSAAGVKSDAFAGVYPQTDVFVKILAAAGLLPDGTRPVSD